jgi:RNA polymerase sigma factor (sigma-70 family)
MSSSSVGPLPTKQNIHQFLAKDVDEYFPPMYWLFQQDIKNHITYKLSKAKANDAIEICVQETFEKTFASLKRKTTEEILRLDRFEAWLIKIAENVVNDWYDKNRSYFTTVLPKTRARLTIYVDSIDLEGSESGKQPLDIPDGDEQKQPESTLLWKEKRTELREYMNMLPEKNRLAIKLHFFDGLTLEQIASKRGLILSTVKARVYRGIGMLYDYFVVVQALDEMKESIRTYILKIPSSCGTVMKLHFLEGMKLPDVAIRCNYSVEKVKRLLYHGTSIVATHLRAENEKRMQEEGEY